MTNANTPLNGIRPETKRDQLIALLRRKNPLTVKALSTKLGWQNHTTRSAISRLRTAGLEIETIRGENGKSARYRLPPRPAAGAASAEAVEQ